MRSSALRRGRRGRGGNNRSVRPVLVDRGIRRPLTGLAGALAPDVDQHVRIRGDTYFRQNRVTPVGIAAERLAVDVKGKGGDYNVVLEMAVDDEKKRATVSAICNCPYYTGGKGYCKHIWAAICYADGTADSQFKAPEGQTVSFLNLLAGAGRKLSAVASAEPDASGRIRAFSASDLTPASQSKSDGDRQHGKHQEQSTWREAVKQVGHQQRDNLDQQKKAQSLAVSDIYYVIDAEATRKTGQLTIQIYRQMPAEEGANKFLVAAPADLKALDLLPDGPDRDILTWFFGVAGSALVRSGAWEDGVVPIRGRSHSYVVAETLRPRLIAQLVETGRFGWLSSHDVKGDGSAPVALKHFRPLAADHNSPWTFRLAIAYRKQDGMWLLRGEFRRGRITIPLGDALCAFPDGSIIFKELVTRYDLTDPRLASWVATMRQTGTVKIPKQEHPAFLRSFVDVAVSPPLDLPSDAGWKLVVGVPKPRLIFSSQPFSEKAMVLMANYEFDYEAPQLPQVDPNRQPEGRRGRDRRGRRRGLPEGQQPADESLSPSLSSVDDDDQSTAPAEGGDDSAVATEEQAPQQDQRQPPRLLLRRDRTKEEQRIRELHDHVGVHPSAGRNVTGADVFVDAANLSGLVADLSAHGWVIEAEGKKLRTGTSFNIDVKTNVDWLDLRARFDFGGGATVELPKLLQALRRGEDRVQLGDGTVGLLPEAWLKRLDPILKMGEGADGDDVLRYQHSHAAFLDILAQDATVADLDQQFTDYRKKLASFSGVTEASPTKDFVGELRPYQKQGLGWLEFLEEFNFGGCLADDMGLGKTVQVLAHLQKKRKAHTAKTAMPSLIVAPTSLIYNWADEAAKFTPNLKVCTHVGASRRKKASELKAFDLVITSYGTMRSDVELLASVMFDYVILDEAQAIKNETTQSAKAARSLKSHRRLAMSGTPVENRLAELASIFRFLNPGMLDNAQGFAELFSAAGKSSPGKIETLAKALRPFILRRTKEQVLKELPGKTESTIYCVLDDDQRQEYDQMAAHYRESLAKKAKSLGMGKAKMHVLEALLRLRQLSCHPGLIAEDRRGEQSAKLDLLEEKLDEVIESQRKALVFSQFTTMLSLVRDRLDAKGIKYEYLDGSTTDRKGCVERFQNDPEIRVFLISLKAGGVGLNLTAADYCFILDPWWNPASEAQAIDRAHRIGQQNHVFAYRLITRGTVEEKILALQAAKRTLVEGLIAEDGGMLADLSAKDLDYLFG